MAKLVGNVMAHYHSNGKTCALFKCHFTLVCAEGWKLHLWVMVLCVKGSVPGFIHCGWMFLLSYLHSSNSELCECCEC
jgi:hypothetical protein